MRFRIIILMMTVLLAATVLTSCGGGAEKQTAEQAAQQAAEAKTNQQIKDQQLQITELQSQLRQSNTVINAYTDSLSAARQKNLELAANLGLSRKMIVFSINQLDSVMAFYQRIVNRSQDSVVTLAQTLYQSRYEFAVLSQKNARLTTEIKRYRDWYPYYKAKALKKKGAIPPVPSGPQPMN